MALSTTNRLTDKNISCTLPYMKTKTRQRRKTLRLKIIEHFDTQGSLAYESGIDEAVISKIINCVRDPSKGQSEILCRLLKTKEGVLFKKV